MTPIFLTFQVGNGLHVRSADESIIKIIYHASNNIEGHTSAVRRKDQTGQHIKSKIELASFERLYS